MNRKEFNIAVDLHSDGIYRFILKSINDTEMAKDLVQTCYTKLWEKVADVEFEKVKSYLFTSAYHLIINTSKQNKKVERLAPQHDKHASTSINFDLNDILLEALNKIPEKQKTVVLLRDYEGYNYQEIAEITQLSEAQVKVYIFRARKALKAYLGKIENLI